jgi:DNA-binding Xre family transcriptional regulator
MFKSNVKKIMKDSGIRTVFLSEKTGLSSATIAKARQDAGIAECRLSTLGRIANALEVPVKTLFDGEYGVPEDEVDGEREGPAGKESGQTHLNFASLSLVRHSYYWLSASLMQTPFNSAL